MVARRESKARTRRGSASAESLVRGTAPPPFAPPPGGFLDDGAPGDTRANGTAAFPAQTLPFEARLVVERGLFAGKMLVLGDGTVSIGRSSKCELSLKGAAGVSRRHCKIQLVGAHYVLLDLESRNGTVVNGKPRARHVLEEGDVIELGDEHVVFRTTQKMVVPPVPPDDDVPARAPPPPPAAARPAAPAAHGSDTAVLSAPRGLSVKLAAGDAHDDDEPVPVTNPGRAAARRDSAKRARPKPAANVRADGAGGVLPAKPSDVTLQPGATGPRRPTAPLAGPAEATASLYLDKGGVEAMLQGTPGYDPRAFDPVVATDRLKRPRRLESAVAPREPVRAPPPPREGLGMMPLVAIIVVLTVAIAGAAYDVTVGPHWLVRQLERATAGLQQTGTTAPPAPAPVQPRVDVRVGTQPAAEASAAPIATAAAPSVTGAPLAAPVAEARTEPVADVRPSAVAAPTDAAAQDAPLIAAQSADEVPAREAAVDAAPAVKPSDAPAATVAVVDAKAAVAAAADVAPAAPKASEAKTAARLAADAPPPPRSVTVAAGAAGRVASVRVHAGDKVKSGDPLGTVTARTSTKKLATLRAEAQQFQDAVAHGSAGAQQDLAEVRAEIARIEASGRPVTFVANIDGTVVEVVAHPGDNVQSSTTVIRIAPE